MRLRLARVLFATAATAAAHAEVRMPQIFGGHMVLQQGATLPIWGWAAPGERVDVTFAGQTADAVGGADGRWRVALRPVAAEAQGRVLTVRGATTLEFRDVVVGDVWIGSGQSNMELGIRDQKPCLQDVEHCEDPLIRLFFVPRTTSLWPLAIGAPPQRAQGSGPPPTGLRGFGIAGADRTFVWATAVIEGDAVVVASAQVPAPLAVRYDFAYSPSGDLFNQEGLPASPFRTDEWDDRDC